MIFIECKPDRALLESLVTVKRKDIAHEFKGRGEICKRLRGSKKSLGIIDEDPQSPQPAYLKEAKLEKESSEHGLRVLHHAPGDNYIIVLCPRLEDWILRAAGEINIDVRKYGLPNNATRLHSIININLDKFKDLLGQLKESVRIKTLRNLIRERL